MYILGNEGSFSNTVIKELKLKNPGNIFENYLIKKDVYSSVAIKDSISWIRNFKKINSIKNNVYYHQIKSDHGHDAFFMEFNQIEHFLKTIF